VAHALSVPCSHSCEHLWSSIENEFAPHAVRAPQRTATGLKRIIDAMPPSPGEITHVSDTALMVAACRALESECADGFVHDPFAARLAGERGLAILRGMPHAEILRFGMGIRSRFIDELLLDALASNPIATVLSLGSGLDTRPWRLELPSDLRWIEVDFADMLDYKEALMSAEMPHCRRQRITADLNDAAQRRTIYAAVGPAPALMIAEGLLMYLPAATVEALAAETPRESAVAHCISEIMTTAFSKAISRDTTADPKQPIRHVLAPDALEGEQILDCLHRHGWVTAARRSYITDLAFATERIQRMTGDHPQPPPPYPPGDPTGVHRFARG
jgi:methyltransferase (TIGR00027 family)